MAHYIIIFVRWKGMGTCRQGVTVPRSHQAVRVNPAKDNSWPKHSSQRATQRSLSLHCCLRGARFLDTLFHLQAHISCIYLSSHLHFLHRSFVVRLCASVAMARGGHFKAHCWSLFLLISYDRCIPLTRAEFELFIKAHESIKRCFVVRHKLMHSLAFFLPS